MKGYVIKVTYLSGAHKGRSYFLKKGGYIYSDGEFVLADNVYKSEAVAKRVCSLYANNNERDYLSERSYNEYRISKGHKGCDWFIYELESYEPYELDETVIV